MTARGPFQPEFFNVSIIFQVFFLFDFCASGFVWLSLVICSEICVRNNSGWPRFEDLLNDDFAIEWSFFNLHKFLIYKSCLACFVDLPISKNFWFDTQTAKKKIFRMGVTQVGNRKGDSVTH